VELRIDNWITYLGFTEKTSMVKTPHIPLEEKPPPNTTLTEVILRRRLEFPSETLGQFTGEVENPH
jgi:hypothetical protein